MLMIELFAGRRSMSRAFEKLGFETKTYDWNPELHTDYCADINDLTIADMEGADVIWASPDCTKFSYASGAKNEFRAANEDPLSSDALDALKTVEHTIQLCKEAEWYWFLENPDHGALAHQDIMKGLPIETVAYCSYGHDFRKYTNIWGRFPPSWKARSWCSHNHHPNIKQHGNAQDRSIIPDRLCEEIARSCLADSGRQIETLQRWME